jgi:outer membrane protein TolC
LEELIDQARTNHPELQKLGVKLRQLEVERRLAAEYLKPRLDLNYYFLNQPFDPEGNTSLHLGDNYKLGMDFSFPLFLRKERSKVALVKLKLSNTIFERSLTERQIVNELNSAYNQLTNINTVRQAQRDMMQNYQRLLDAELLNLQEGESDLFRINLQQEKLIQSQTKWLKLVAEYEKQKAYLYWAAGVRNLAGLN